MTEVMTGAETYDTAATLADHVVGNVHGLLTAHPPPTVTGQPRAANPHPREQEFPLTFDAAH